MITTINEFRKINESNNEVKVVVLTNKELIDFLVNENGELKDPTIYQRIRYFDHYNLIENKRINPFYVVLLKGKLVIGVAKIGYFYLSEPNENTRSISLFSIDKDYRNMGYSRLMADTLFKYAKEKRFDIQTSAYSVLGKEYLQPLFNEYAKKYNVHFIDKKDSDRLADTESMYKIVNGKKLHWREIE